MKASRSVASLTLACVLALAVAGSAAASPSPAPQWNNIASAAGIAGSWSQKGVDYAREIAIAIVERTFSTFELPSINFDKDSFSGTVSNFKCEGLRIGSSISQLEAGRGVNLGIDDITMSCSANWNYRENVWPHIPRGSGSVDADSTNTGLGAVIQITASGGKPQVHSLSCSASVDIGNLEFHGGRTADLLDLFKGLIEKHIDSSMNSMLCTQLDSIINSKFNQVLDGFHLDAPINLPGAFNIANANFGLLESPDVQSEYLGIELIGEVVNRAHPTNPPFAPNPLPAFSSADADHMVQMYFSEFVFNSGAWVFQQADLLKFVVTPAMVPSESPVKLNTSDFVDLAPGMASKYPNTGVDIEFATTMYPALHAYPAGVNVTAGVALTFAPWTTPTGSPVFGFELNCTVAANFDMSVNTSKPEKLQGKVDYIDCPLGLVRSAVGTVAVADIQSLVDFIFEGLVLPKVNTILEAGFPLPSADGIEFVNSELKFGLGFMEVATDIQYVGPGL